MWIKEMAAEVKRYDRNHLLFVGDVRVLVACTLFEFESTIMKHTHIVHRVGSAQKEWLAFHMIS